ncbi:hypothetical protein OSB04_013411 [Centaurea solstitialis]|uniref:CRIB domain-containing protein n=1 Tax=Centaurea solstitialis TaxID=347529 RepID=A0AA38WFH0_9ASTR|nr:hypothetical protein OSB04_013411 [Centaurea solstitialis]
MEETVFTPAIEGMKKIKSDHDEILTKPFLDVCKMLLPILDKFGAAMAVVKSDISGNISRLDSKYTGNPTRFNYLYALVQAEVETKTAKSSSSCTNGLLWLTRAMDFLVELFRNLYQHQDWSMQQACNDSYSKTLKKWHGWIASSSFTVAIKLVPDRKKFMEVIASKGDVYADMDKFCTSFSPLLAQIHKFLVRFLVAESVSMGTAVKGLLKGLRYISEIFEADNDKEPEIQIGMPTDVKHVAHIGCDGPSTNAPSWMNDFQGSEGSSDIGGSKDSFVTCSESMSSQTTRRGKSKQPKKHGGSVGSSPDIEPRARRNKNSTGDSPMNDRPRRSKNSSAAGAESPSQEPGTRKTRKKKTPSDGNTRPSRTKNRESSTPDNTD